MNNYSCIGNLGQDPEIKYLDSSRVCKFSVAIRGYRDDDTIWLDCEAWNKTADIVSDYCKKGSQVGLSGSLKQQSWNDKETGAKRSKIIFNVDRVTLLGRKEGQVAPQSDLDVDF